MKCYILYVIMPVLRTDRKMAKAKRTITTAAQFVRQFSHFSDVSLARPVFVTRNGRTRNVMISAEEYERLKRRDIQVFRAEDSPDELIADLETYVRSRKR